MSTIVDQIGQMLNISRGSGGDDAADRSPEVAEEVAGTAEATEATTVAGTLVHECPACDEVYLSEGPRRCSTCGETTAPIDPR